jgi:hypothetical protein
MPGSVLAADQHGRQGCDGDQENQLVNGNLLSVKVPYRPARQDCLPGSSWPETV